MTTKADKERKDAKRRAVVARLHEIETGTGFEILSGIWEERTLDALILALGIGHVELDAGAD